MKILVTTAALLLMAVLPARWLAVRAQAPAWQMAAVAGNPATSAVTSRVFATAPDGAGNVLVVGTFNGTASFGGTSLTSAGGDDVFVAKWRPATGTYVWAARGGGVGNDVATAVAVSGANVYVAGGFIGTGFFGGVATSAINGTDGFLAKLTDAGTSATFEWVQRLGGAGFDQATGVAASGASVYVVGGFDTSAGFGTLSLASAGGGDVFVVKFADAGTFSSSVWARRAGGTGTDRATSVAVSGANVYVGGSFASPVASFGATNLSGSITNNAFVTKLADAGTTGDFVWARQGSSTSANSIDAVAVSSTGLYVGGVHNATLGLGTILLPTAGGPDGFVARLTDAGITGDFVWGQRLGGAGTDGVTALAASGPNVYAGGHFAGVAGFGSTTVTSAGNLDVFVAKLFDAGANGNFEWVQRAGGVGLDSGGALALTTAGALYAGGFVAPPATFGTLQVATPYAGAVGFLAALAGNALPTAADTPLAALALYPNPAHGRATVQLPALPGATTATLAILDALGRTIRTQAAATNAPAELDLTGLAPGLYAVRVQAGAATAMRRLVVE